VGHLRETLPNVHLQDRFVNLQILPLGLIDDPIVNQKPLASPSFP
jgi:hypothetical protein